MGVVTPQRSTYVLMNVHMISILFTALFIGVTGAPFRRPGSVQTRFERLVRDNFDKSFTQSCQKYKFVEQYWNQLEHPTGRVVEFIYSSKVSKEGDFGGVGDRLGGLITATAIALRFGRTLVIRADDDFYDYFRPYRDPSVGRNRPLVETFSYANASTWASYSTGKKSTVMDLTDCVNPEYKPQFYYQPENINRCGLDNYEAAELSDKEIIRLQANRCYLCKWMNNRTEFAYSQLVHELGLSESDNLYEVGGCMLRLVMWPTNRAISQLAELVWHFIEGAHYSRPFSAHEVPMNTTMLLNFPKVNNQLDTDVMKGFATHLEQYRLHHQYFLSSRAENQSFPHPPPRPRRNRGGSPVLSLPFMLGTHFRCGDLFIKGTVDSSHCEYNVTNPEKSDGHVMRAGTPAGIGNCAHVVATRLMQLSAANSMLNRSELLIHVATDNARSSQQIRSFAANNVFNKNIYISPVGCHIDINSTSTCQQETLLHFLLLSLSHVLIIPLEHGVFPSSGFSRFAAIYGLRSSQNNIILSPWDCTGISTAPLSNMTHGNWICDDQYDLMADYAAVQTEVARRDRKRVHRQLLRILFDLSVFGMLVGIKFYVGGYVLERCGISWLNAYRRYIMVIVVMVWLYCYFLF
jgi:hypothetical protein